MHASDFQASRRPMSTKVGNDPWQGERVFCRSNEYKGRFGYVKGVNRELQVAYVDFDGQAVHVRTSLHLSTLISMYVFIPTLRRLQMLIYSKEI